jgi:Na+-transporting NADH:ubiquinone oxidoreductase subunit NqrB
VILLQDARDYQILFLSLFLFLGIRTRDWTLRWDMMLVTIVSCLLAQVVLVSWFAWRQARKSSPGEILSQSDAGHCGIRLTNLSSLKSAAITSLGLCLLLRANSPGTMAIAACLAVASKFIFRVRDKHFFNPANFGIIGTLVLTNDVWVSPGQWGADWWYILLFLGTGGTILKKVGRWDTSIAFLVSYIGLETARNLWLGFGWDVWSHQFSSGSLLLFAFFMITDPRSIPNARTSRLIWSVSLAIVAFILQHQFYLSTAVFWSLFCLSPLTVLLDFIWEAPRFDWQLSTSDRDIQPLQISDPS